MFYNVLLISVLISALILTVNNFNSLFNTTEVSFSIYEHNWHKYKSQKTMCIVLVEYVTMLIHLQVLGIMHTSICTIAYNINRCYIEIVIHVRANAEFR